MKKDGELTESVVTAILYVTIVHLNAIHQEIIHVAMKNSSRVEKQKNFVYVQDVLIIGPNPKKMDVRLQR